MPFITKQFLENYKPKKDYNIHNGFLLFESVEMNYETYDLFISYSSKDLDYVKKLASYLADSGYLVYLDDNDSVLDKNKVTKETAKRLARIMENCKCLMYVFTTSSKESSWCPWEIGYMSAIRDFKCTIFPILDISEDYIEHREYLLNYPTVHHVPNPDGKGGSFFVKDGSCINLVEYI